MFSFFQIGWTQSIKNWMKKNQRNAEPDKIQLNLIIDWLLSLRVFGAKIKSRQIIIPILTNTGIKHFNKTF